MNCSTRIHHQNEVGYSTRCTCQRAVHLAFGNICWLLPKSQLNDVASYFTDLGSPEACIEDKFERLTDIPTQVCSRMFGPSLIEMNKVSEFHHQTLFMVRVDQENLS